LLDKFIWLAALRENGATICGIEEAATGPMR
jgi:hypothetical protein